MLQCTVKFYSLVWKQPVRGALQKTVCTFSAVTRNYKVNYLVRIGKIWKLVQERAF